MARSQGSDGCTRGDTPLFGCGAIDSDGALPSSSSLVSWGSSHGSSVSALITLPCVRLGAGLRRAIIHELYRSISSRLGETHGLANFGNTMTGPSPERRRSPATSAPGVRGRSDAHTSRLGSTEYTAISIFDLMKTQRS